MSFGTLVENSVYSGGQPSFKEFKNLKAVGYRRIIDLRPSSEGRDFDEKAEAAREQLDYIVLPIASEQDLTSKNVKRFAELLAETSAPMTLVHCASSNRVGAMFALRAAWYHGAAVEAALNVGKMAGLKGLEGAVRTAIANGAQ